MPPRILVEAVCDGCGYKSLSSKGSGAEGPIDLAIPPRWIRLIVQANRASAILTFSKTTYDALELYCEDCAAKINAARSGQAPTEKPKRRQFNLTDDSPSDNLEELFK